MRGKIGRGCEGLEEFIITYLSSIDPRYHQTKDIIIKVFRHGFAHGGLSKKGSAISRERDDRHLSLLSVADRGYVLVLDVEILRSHLKMSITNYNRDLLKNSSSGMKKRKKIMHYIDELEKNSRRLFSKNVTQLIQDGYTTESTSDPPKKTAIFPVQLEA